MSQGFALDLIPSSRDGLPGLGPRSRELIAVYGGSDLCDFNGDKERLWSPSPQPTQGWSATGEAPGERSRAPKGFRRQAVVAVVHAQRREAAQPQAVRHDEHAAERH